jgi:hypothetical protein
MVNINKTKSKHSALRKNGHKMDCSCHICDNIRNKEKSGGYRDEIIKENERKIGIKKKNGHRMNCKCIICENMKNKKTQKKNSVLGRKEDKLNGYKSNTNKKLNGHKDNCNCPICKNMLKKNRKTKKRSQSN